MEGPVKDAGADKDSKEDKIGPLEDDKPLDAEKGLQTVIPTEKAEAETDPRQGGESEEGKRSEVSKSKCSMLQSLIFGSLQKFFMAQVRNISITPPPIMSSTL